MRQATTSWQWCLMLVAMGPMLHGCRSVSDWFPSVPASPLGLVDRSALHRSDPQSTDLAPKSSASPDRVAEGVPPWQASVLMASDEAVASDEVPQRIDTATIRTEPSPVAVATAENSIDEAVFDLDAFPAVGTALSLHMPSLHTAGLQTPVERVGTPGMPALPATQASPLSVVDRPAPRLVISGIRPGQGDVRIALFTSPQGFPQPNGASRVLALNSATDRLEVPVQMETPFAVAVFQDINGDGELSKNRFGIPIEPFAFSNNAMGNRGPPEFDAAKVHIPPSASTPLVIPIRLP
jgi:uncharacterized protein (DUF2141 family)